MKKSFFLFMLLFAFTIAASSLNSCREQSTSEKVEDSMEEAGDDIEDAADDAGDEMEDAVDDN